MVRNLAIKYDSRSVFHFLFFCFFVFPLWLLEFLLTDFYFVLYVHFFLHSTMALCLFSCFFWQSFFKTLNWGHPKDGHRPLHYPLTLYCYFYPPVFTVLVCFISLFRLHFTCVRIFAIGANRCVFSADDAWRKVCRCVECVVDDADRLNLNAVLVMEIYRLYIYIYYDIRFRAVSALMSVHTRCKTLFALSFLASKNPLVTFFIQDEFRVLPNDHRRSLFFIHIGKWWLTSECIPITQPLRRGPAVSNCKVPLTIRL